MDTKATVHAGDYSRHGRSRGLEPVKARDHDMRPKEKLIPGGILEPVGGRAFLFFTTGYKTSDFMVDGLRLWWNERKTELSGVKRLVINLDNGPECSGRCGQFLRRLVEFADEAALDLRLIYYPPYHQYCSLNINFVVFCQKFSTGGPHMARPHAKLPDGTSPDFSPISSIAT